LAQSIVTTPKAEPNCWGTAEECVFMRAELIEVVETELRKFATDLNLSDEQKSQLKTALEKAHERIDEIRAKNPNASRADVVAKLKEARGTIRERVEKFFTPEQLAKWDSGVSKAKTFLGESIEA
jgi:predicted  nucleic acid-binding Zn-ribbon protein